MTVEENKTRIRHWYGEVLGRADVKTMLKVIDETFSPDFVDHDGPDPKNSREALKRVLPGLLKSVPDVRFTIEQLFGEGDLVAMRVRGEATHTVEVTGIKPTGKRIAWTENEIFRFGRNGQVVESWGEGTLEEALAEIGLKFGAGGR